MEFGLTFQKQLGINRSQLTNSMIFQRGRYTIQLPDGHVMGYNIPSLRDGAVDIG